MMAARLHHGGRLVEAAARFGVPVSDWLDLSTGLNPHGYPVPPVPPEVWRRLPDDDDDRLAAACRVAYGASSVLPVAGTQAALQALPRVLSALQTSSARGPWRVRVRALSYNEHARAWSQAGHRVDAQCAATAGLDDVAALERGLDEVDVLVLVNPNNPGGERVPAERLLDWQSRLAQRGGWLVVDEAYLDALSDEDRTRLSVAPWVDRSGLVVLRSVGKFYGLAGIRVGALLASAPVLAAMRTELGPWAVSGPSAWVAAHALGDTVWAVAMRATLAEADARLGALLHEVGLMPRGGPLYRCCVTPRARAWHEALARQGVWTRYFDPDFTHGPAAWRLGLPGDEAGWVRLEQALRSAKLLLDAPRSSR